jgi:predicted metal-binding membrane protein
MSGQDQIQPVVRRQRRRLRIIAVSTTAIAAWAVPLTAHDTGANAAAPALAGSRQMHRLEAHGYVASACTRKGTLMVNPNTGQRVTVNPA